MTEGNPVEAMHKLAQGEGYSGSIEDFQQLLKDDPKALGTMYNVALNNGYEDSFPDFEILMGLKKKEEAVTESALEDGLSERKLASYEPEVRAYDARLGGIPGYYQADREPYPYDTPAEVAMRDSAMQAYDETAAAALEEEAKRRELEAAKISRTLPTVEIPEGDTPSVLSELSRLYGRFGFQFQESDGVVKVFANAADGTTVELTLEVDEEGKIPPSEANKLDPFIRQNAQRLSVVDETLAQQSLRARNLREVPRVEGDEVSTVKMAYGDVDGKFVAYPTLFPKDPNNYGTSSDDWVEKDFGFAALDEAMKRNEVFYFDTEEEAADFAGGNWKTIDEQDLTFEKMWSDMGRNYWADQAFLNELGKRREEFLFLEELPGAGIRYEEDKFGFPVEEIPEEYKGYFIDGNMVRDDIKDIIEQKRSELQGLEDRLGGDLLDLKEKRDEMLNARFKQLSSDAAEMNRDAQLEQNRLEASAMMQFGLPLNELFEKEPETQAELANMMALYNDYSRTIEQKRFAATSYERAQTFYNKQHDKSLTDEYVDGWEEVTVAWDNGWKRGEAMSKLLLMQMGYYDAIGDPEAEKEAMREVSQIMDSIDPRTGKVVSRANATGTSNSFVQSLAKNPALYTAAITAESLGQLLPLWKNVALPIGAVGGAVGAAAGGVGALPGAASGFLTGAAVGFFNVGMPLSELALEAGNAVLDTGERMGYNWSDPNSSLKALEDEKMWREATERGLERGVPISVMGAASNYFIGRAVGAASQFASLAQRVARGALTGLVVEPITEGLGETAALMTSGEFTGSTQNLKEIAAESIGAIGMGIGMGTTVGGFNYAGKVLNDTNFKLAHNLLSPEFLAKQEESNSRIVAWTNKMEKLGKITSEQAEGIRRNVGRRRKANELLGKPLDAKPGNDATVIGRIIKLLEAKEELEASGESVFSEKIREITEEIATIAERGKVLKPGEGAVSLRDIEARIRKRRPGSYKFNGRNVTKQDFLEKIKTATPRQLRRAKVYGDPETLFDLAYAIQKRKAAKVPLGKQPGASAEVEQEVSIEPLTQADLDAKKEDRLNPEREVYIVGQLADKVARGEALTDVETQYYETYKEQVDLVVEEFKGYDQEYTPTEVTAEDDYGDGVNVVRTTDVPFDAKQQSVLRQAQRSVASLAKRFPQVKFILHDNDASYQAAYAKASPGKKASGSGFYVWDDKAVHVNLADPNLKLTTVPHETFHAILRNSIGSADVQVLMKDFVTTLKKVIDEDSDLARDLAEFQRLYDEGQMDEEFVAEFFGRLTEAFPTLNRKGKTVIARFLERLGKLIGFDLTLPKNLTARDKQILELLERLSGKVATGEAITKREQAEFGKLRRSLTTDGRRQDDGVSEQRVEVPDSVADIVEAFGDNPVFQAVLSAEKSKDIYDALRRTPGTEIFRQGTQIIRGVDTTMVLAALYLNPRINESYKVIIDDLLIKLEEFAQEQTLPLTYDARTRKYVGRFDYVIGGNNANYDKVILNNAKISLANPDNLVEQFRTFEAASETIIHEAIHGVTALDIVFGDGKAAREFDRISKALRKYIKDNKTDIEQNNPEFTRRFGRILKDVTKPAEVVTYGLTNPVYQELLKQIPDPDGPKQSLWNRFVNAVRDALGLTNKETTLLDSVLVAYGEAKAYRVGDELTSFPRELLKAKPKPKPKPKPKNPFRFRPLGSSSTQVSEQRVDVESNEDNSLTFRTEGGRLDAFPDGNVVTLDNIAVRPEAQRQGVATRLVRAVMDEFRDQQSLAVVDEEGNTIEEPRPYVIGFGTRVTRQGDAFYDSIIDEVEAFNRRNDGPPRFNEDGLAEVRVSEQMGLEEATPEWMADAFKEADPVLRDFFVAFAEQPGVRLFLNPMGGGFFYANQEKGSTELDVRTSIYMRDGGVHLDLLEVITNPKSQGAGTRFMQDFVAALDATNAEANLMAWPPKWYQQGMSEEEMQAVSNRLKGFYGRFGFTPNRFGDSMTRKPGAGPVEVTEAQRRTDAERNELLDSIADNRNKQELLGNVIAQTYDVYTDKVDPEELRSINERIDPYEEGIDAIDLMGRALTPEQIEAINDEYGSGLINEEGFAESFEDFMDSDIVDDYYDLVVAAKEGRQRLFDFDGGISERRNSLETDGTGINLEGNEEVQAGDVSPTVMGTQGQLIEDFRLSDMPATITRSTAAAIGAARRFASGKITYKKDGKKVEVTLPYRNKKLQSLLNRRVNALKKTSNKAKRAELFARISETTQQIFDGMVDAMAQNVLAVYDTLTPEFVQASKEWYVGANRTANELARMYNLTVEQAAGILAALSPQNEWFNNIAVAERVIEVMTNHRDTPFSQEILDKAVAKNTTKGKPSSWANDLIELYGKHQGKTLNQLQAEGVPMTVQSILLRAIDQALYPGKVAMTTPDGDFFAFDSTPIRWSSPVEIAKSMDMFLNPDIENIRTQLGKGNKVRNFYNNIVDPRSANPYVTADTHAAAVALGVPMSSEDAGGIGLFNGGQSMVYMAIKEAYIKAAEVAGIQPREMQSITWEAVRTGLNNKNRSKAQIQSNVTKLESLLDDESMTPYERARRIIIDNRTENPGWATQRGIEAQIPDLRQGVREQAESRASEVLSLRGRPGRDVGAADAGVGVEPSGVSEQRTIVYRSGDLVNKGEPRTEAESGRSTGHFGTGFYFYGDKSTAESDAESRNRPVTELDITDYNLAPASYFLHAALQEVNKRAARTEGRHVITPEEVQYAQVAVEQGPSFRDFYYMDDALRIYKDQLLDTGTAQRIAAEATRRYNEEAGTQTDRFGRGEFLDSASTAVMKALGYEGVNAVGTELDNYTYGTVIYDVKPRVSEQRTAPNGQPSNLNEVQYDLVRTPEFKSWFGDWEEAYRTGNYDGVSKIIDENGEPMVVYHGSVDRGITEFTEEGARERRRSGLNELGVFFSSNRDLAQDYAKGRAEQSRVADRQMRERGVERDDVRQGNYVPSVYAAFLDMKNPYRFDGKGQFYPDYYENVPYLEIWPGYGKRGKRAVTAYLGGNTAYETPYDGVVAENVIDYHSFASQPEFDPLGDTIIVPFSSKPTIKLADGRNTTFSSASANISEQRIAPERPKPTAVELRKLRSPEFKAWFGDWENDPENASKVVDANGFPLKVYHAGESEIQRFSYDLTMGGFFFTPSREDAENFAKEYRPTDSPFVGEYYVNIRDPKFYERFYLSDTKESYTGDAIEQEMEVAARLGYEQFKMTNYPGRARKLLNRELMQWGADGINIAQPDWEDSIGTNSEQWVAFYPNSIKSTDAKTFDSSSPNVSEQRSALEAMSDPNDSMHDIVRKGREALVTDEAIVAMLVNRYGRKSLPAIRKAMDMNTDTFTAIPKEFGNVEGGIIEGRQIFEEVRRQLQQFMNGKQEPLTKQNRQRIIDELREQHPEWKGFSDTQVLRKRPLIPPTKAEVRAEAKRLLESNARFQKQTPTVQDALVVAFDKSLNTRANKDIQNLISQIRRDIRQRNRGAKERVALQRRVRALMRDVLPNTDYNRRAVNSLLSVLNEINEKNFYVKMGKLMDEVDAARERQKEQTIRRIEKLVARAAKTTKTSGGRVRTRGLDAPGQAFFAQAKIVLDAIRSRDEAAIDDIIRFMEESKSLEYQDALESYRAGLKLNRREQELIDRMTAFDLFADLNEKNLEQVEAILEDLLLTEGFSRVALKQQRLANAARAAAIRGEASADIRRNYGSLILNAKGEPMDDNELGAKRSLVRKLWQKDPYKSRWQRLKDMVGEMRQQSAAALARKGSLVTHLGTYTSILGEFFFQNIYEAVNGMEENYLRGLQDVQKTKDDIANSIEGIENGFSEIARLIFSTTEKTTLTTDGMTRAYHMDELMRLYALSLNPDQRRKLLNQGFDERVMQTIKDTLGPQLSEYAEKIAEYLAGEYYEGINDVYSELNNINLPHVENYFPTRSLTTESVTVGQAQNIMGYASAQTASALKERTNMQGPVELGSEAVGIGFVESLDNHLRSMERFKAYALGTRDINTIMSTPEFRTLLKTFRGNGLMNLLVNHAVDPEKFVSPLSQGTKVANWLISRYTMSVLFFKAWQAVKQASSAIMAFTDYKYKPDSNLAQDLIMFSVDAAVLTANLAAEMATLGKYKGPLREAMDISATLENRVKRAFAGEVYSLESGVAAVRNPREAYQKTKKAYALFRAVGGAFTSFGDIMGVMGYMVNYRRDIKNGMNPDEALAKFNSYNMTQQSRRPADRVPVQIYQNALSRMVVAFMSTSLLYLNNTLRHANNILRAQRTGKKVSGKDIRGLAMNGVFGHMIYQAVANLFLLLQGDDEDKEKFARVVGWSPFANVFAIPILGDMIETVVNELQGNNYRSTIGVNPFERPIKDFSKAIKEEEYGKAAADIAAYAVGANTDFAGAALEISQGEDVDENIYELIGVPKSARPE